MVDRPATATGVLAVLGLETASTPPEPLAWPGAAEVVAVAIGPSLAGATGESTGCCVGLLEAFGGVAVDAGLMAEGVVTVETITPLLELESSEVLLPDAGVDSVAFCLA